MATVKISKEELNHLVKTYHSGNTSKKKEVLEIVLKNMDNYIFTKIRAYPCRASYFEDLTQCARIAVIENFRNYNPNKGSLRAFFGPYIFSAIYDFLSETEWQGSRYFMQKSKAWKDTDIRTADPFNISVATGFPLSTIHHGRTIVEMNDPVGIEKAFGLISNEKSVVEIVESNDLYHCLYSAINSLSEVEKYIVLSTYGVGTDVRSVTTQSYELGIPKKEIKRLLVLACDKIKTNLKDYF